MGVAKSLRKSGHLSLFAQGLGSIIDNLVGDRSIDDLIKNINKTGEDIESRFEPRLDPTKTDMTHNYLTGPFFRGAKTQDQFNLRKSAGSPENKVDYEAGGQESYRDLIEFIKSQIGKDVDPTQLQQGITALEMQIESYLPGEKEDKKGYTGETKEGYWKVKDDGSLEYIANPNYKEKADKKRVKYGDNVYEVVDGEIDWENPVYKIPKKTKTGEGTTSEYPDVNVTDINLAIKKIDMLKGAKFDEETNTYEVADDSKRGTFYNLSRDDLRNEIEKEKIKVGKKVADALKDQGLISGGDDGAGDSAVGDIRAILDKLSGGEKRRLSDLQEAMEIFKKMNPDFNDDLLYLLERYFTLHLE